MSTILLLTVGGSHQPIVTSIGQHRPDSVHFLCSDDVGKTRGSYVQVIGEGLVLKSHKDLDKPDLPNIVTLAGLKPEQFHVHKIRQFDNLNDCYLETARLIEQIRGACPAARIVADYTGGTKSMTAGLAAAALDDGRCDISLVAGQRSDLVAVQDQSEFVRPVHVWDAQAIRRMRAAREQLRRFDYAAAEHILRDAAARFAGDNTLQQLQRGIALCRAFDAWDKFKHDASRPLLQPYRAQFVSHCRVLDALAGRAAGHGLEAVEDLLCNAERRAAQERYDDAVGRVYRAIELTAQVWLQARYGINTSAVATDAVPEPCRGKLERLRAEDGAIKIGLLSAWDLIAAFDADPLGRRFATRRGRLLDFLSVRNSSLFAHGQRPVAESDYRKHLPVLVEFLQTCIGEAVAALNLKRPVVLEQLPTSFLD
jgi:hypothetical protein